MDTYTAGGDSIAQAYRDAIQTYDSSRSHLTITVNKPINSLSIVPNNREEWDLTMATDILNIGQISQSFLTAEIDGGKTIQDWMDDDIDSYLTGPAYGRLRGKADFWEVDQLKQVIEYLQKDHPSGSESNKMVCHIFHPSELPPNSPRIKRDTCNCNTSIQFKPTDNSDLNCLATFRSQYLNTRAFGNIVGLSALLADVCNRVDYSPGKLINTTNNATVKREDSMDIDQIRGIV